MRKVKDWITGFVELTENSEPPRLYREWVAVSVMAAALKRKVSLKWGTLDFFPNMYVVLAGPPGKCRKGTAMREGKKMMREIGLFIAPDTVTRERLVIDLFESKTECALPNDQLFFHSSMTIYNEELVQLFTVNGAELVKALTIWYDCEPVYEYKTKGSGEYTIINPWVNLIGAMTPSGIQAVFPKEGFGGGLASRMIFVFADQLDIDPKTGEEKIVNFPFPTTKEEVLRENLIADLEAISTINDTFLHTTEMMARWAEWYPYNKKNPPFPHNPRFLGYNERRPTHVMKLAVIMAVSERDNKIDGKHVVTTKAFNRAVDLLERTEKDMDKTFLGLGEGKGSELRWRILKAIQAYGQIKRSELAEIFHNDLGTFKDLTDAIDILVFSKQVSRITGLHDDTLTYIGGSGHGQPTA